MIVLVIGLILFLGVHSIRTVGEDWRGRQIETLGLRRWKGLYSLASVLGFVILVWGYSLARDNPVVIWTPPAGMRHATALFTLIAFIFLAAPNIPGNAFKARVGHPMLIGVKFWAFGHLIANGTLHDIVLFGTFLAWAVVTFIACRRRDRRQGVTYAPGTARGTSITVVAGIAGWAIFAGVLHKLLIGVSPFY